MIIAFASWSVCAPRLTEASILDVLDELSSFWNQLRSPISTMALQSESTRPIPGDAGQSLLFFHTWKKEEERF